MSLIYRAIWEDDPDGIHDRGRASFTWWVTKHHPAIDDFTDGLDVTIGGVTATIRMGAGDQGSIQRCTLHVDDGVERFTTTLTTMAPLTAAPTVATPNTPAPTPGPGSVWVERERVSHRAFASFQVQAPALSTHLIANGVRPQRGPVALSVTHRPLHAEDVPAFTKLLGDPRRDVPIVVIAASPSLDAIALREPAKRTAQMLAGSAAVVLIGPAGRVNLAEILGRDLAVEPGGVRLYLPGVSPSEPNPSRHRAIAPTRVAQDPMAVAQLTVQMLAPATTARRAPADYPGLRRLLDTDVEAMAADHARLTSRVDDLEHRLAVAEDHNLELLADLEDAESRVNLLQGALARTITTGTGFARDEPDTAPPDVDGLRAAARAARRHLTGIVLPDEACRDLDELDQLIEAGAWGRTSWRGLLALDAFALDRDFQPGFWEWCRASRSPFGWPATQKKLAMSESETVMSNSVLKAKRILPIDVAVDPTGRIEMQSHLKIAEGGNHQIPRIYFYDDRHGPTHKVHIGFFGPHRHMPNTLM